DDKATTSYGVGYTELTKIGDNIASSGIRVILNATASSVTYEVLFSLASSQDFVEMEVLHVTGV
ncbi:MAG TPA: hypothetical protein VJH04_02465, partial [archaeon]|nr:hypothetical protein [archaeon]